MKQFFEELAKIGEEHKDFFDTNKVEIHDYIKVYTSPAMVEFNKSVLMRHPLPEEIRKKITYLILNPRRLCSSTYTKSKKKY